MKYERGLLTKYFGIPSVSMSQDKLYILYNDYLGLYNILDSTAEKKTTENNDKVEYQRGLIERINILFENINVARRRGNVPEIESAKENHRIGLLKAKINRINQAVLTGNDVVLKNCIDSINMIINNNKRLDGFCELDEITSSNLFAESNYEYYEEAIRIALSKLTSTYSYISNHRKR